MSTLRISPTLRELGEIRDFVREEGIAMGVHEEAVMDMVTAVDEATTNIVIHGYREHPGPIEVEVQARDRSFVVYLRDEAPPFDPTQVASPNTNLPLDQRPLGGLGIHLMRESVDRLAHQVLPTGGNELTLLKRF